MAYGYQQKEFNKDELFRQKYGTHASWGDKLAFNKYWNSEQREADELAHINSEIAKSNEYWDGVVKQAINRTRGIPEPVKKQEAPSLYKQQDFEQTKMAEMFGTNPSEWDKKRFQTYLKSEQGQKDWLAFDQAEHQKYMDSMDAVTNHAIQRTRQAAVDFKASMKPALVPKPEVSNPEVVASPQPAQPAQPVQSKPAVTPRSNAEWARIAKENGFADMGEVMAWQEANGLEADGKFGKASSAFFKANGLGKYQKTPEGYVELSRQDGTTFLQRYNPKSAPAPAPAPYRKQGGTMNRINYFQQGGAAPQQQDIKAQVVALVQAAMQGDQKATQQVNQIMEAAKAGDQQAMQIAQIMEQVVKELQGQATSAKWGSKLGYIKSLKYAKGGKTCPACEKKVEMKACGGKKAKKRYFGGLV